ncbi:hypothetical protein [Celeribacter indicus]|nr:hypothetical protein [Celeribacter indicus]
MDRQRQEFLDRIGRLSQGPQTAVPPAGPAPTQRMLRNRHLSQMLARHRAETGAPSAPVPRRTLTQVLSCLVAFGIGVLAAFLARALRYQLSGVPVQFGAAPDLALDTIFAIAVAFLLREAVSLSAVKRMGAQLAGILFAMMTLHNAVHAMPDLFSRLLSLGWVAHVVATTAPHTLLILGQSYRL